MHDALLSTLEDAEAARCLLLTDRASGLRAALVLDDLTLGPAAGGVRTRAYPSLAEAVADAAALARAMTIKCALAGLAAGGGKAVVLDHPGLNRPAAFARLGELIDELGGLFRTAGDLGTTAADLAAMASRCRYVHTDEVDLSAAVARGLLRCIEACRALREETASPTVAGLRVAVQGCGAIGSAVARALVAAGASVIVADLDPARARALADALGADVADPAAVLLEDVDVLAPCAVGGVITPHVAGATRAWAVVPGANNALSEPAAEHRLMSREVLFVPDVLASAGAVIEGIGRTVMGLSEGERAALIDGLGATARAVLDAAWSQGALATDVAAGRARARIAAARR